MDPGRIHHGRPGPRRVGQLLFVAVLTVVLSGCGQPDIAAMADAATQQVRLVPHVTGGTISSIYNEFQPAFTCHLEIEPGLTHRQLVTTLDTVVRLVSLHTSTVQQGWLTCNLTSGRQQASLSDLGLTDGSLDAVHQHYS